MLMFQLKGSIVTCVTNRGYLENNFTNGNDRLEPGSRATQF